MSQRPGRRKPASPANPRDRLTAIDGVDEDLAKVIRSAFGAKVVRDLANLKAKDIQRVASEAGRPIPAARLDRILRAARSAVVQESRSAPQGLVARKAEPPRRRRQRREGWKDLATILVYYQHEEGEQARDEWSISAVRTLVHHMESGEEFEWPGFEFAEIASWIQSRLEQHAGSGVDVAHHDASGAHRGTSDSEAWDERRSTTRSILARHGIRLGIRSDEFGTSEPRRYDELEIWRVRISQPSSDTPRLLDCPAGSSMPLNLVADEPFEVRVTRRLRIRGRKGRAAEHPDLKLQLTIYAVRSGDHGFLRVGSSLLDVPRPGEPESEESIRSSGLHAGDYTLRISALLLGPEPVTASTECGPVRFAPASN
ncbi:MAG TPA: hypothetical protein VMU33_19690 [Burkholderiaceae bacterium]|nr:hypothetical protein [Burkholderiaceae bacterium]